MSRPAPERHAELAEATRARLAKLRAAYAEDAEVLAILDRIEATPNVWNAGPVGLVGKEGAVVSWIIDDLRAFREVSMERPSSHDSRTILRWTGSLRSPGATPGLIAGQLNLALIMSEMTIIPTLAALDEDEGSGWYGAPDISPDDIRRALDEVRDAMHLLLRLEKKRLEMLKAFPKIGRKTNSALEIFLSRCLSHRISATFGGKHDELVANIIGVAIGRPHGQTGKRTHDRRRKVR